MAEQGPTDERELEAALENLIETVLPLAAVLTSVTGQVEQARARMADVLRQRQSEWQTLSSSVHNLAVSAAASAQAIGLAGTEVIDALESIDDLLDASTDASSPIVDLADTIAETSEAAHDALKDYVETWIGQQRDALDERVLEAGDQLRETLAAPVVDAVDTVFADLSEAARDAVRESLQPVADELATSVEDLLENLVDRLLRGDEETRQENLALRPVIDMLRPPIEALIDQVERVKPLAAMVGMG
jgi:hypothetical protein